MLNTNTVYPKKYAHGFCFAVLCCGYTLTDFSISIRLTSLALWQSNDCPSASKATLMNMDKYFMWIHYERLHNHNKAKHNKTVCIFLGIYCMMIRVITKRISTHREISASKNVTSSPSTSFLIDFTSVWCHFVTESRLETIEHFSVYYDLPNAMVVRDEVNIWGNLHCTCVETYSTMPCITYAAGVYRDWFSQNY